ncbi:MAG TPA: GGDEF domain-containing protein [Candidatus Limnocylindria bacterium]|jgi:diguanylate cyclase (GGDEF)-like protein
MRRSVRQAVRYGAPMIVVGILADSLHLLLRFGEEGRPAASLGTLGVAVTIGLGHVAVRGRRRPEPAVLGILLVLYAITLVTSRMLTVLTPVTAGYQALILVGSALFLNWSPRWHASWLASAIGLSAVQLIMAPAGAAGPAASELMVAALAALVSGVGQPLAFHRTQRMLVQQFELRQLSGLTRRHEVAVESLNRELVRTARVDTVTGIGNRRALDEAILALTGTRLAAVLLDLDHFKAFNDSNGHLAGDEALARVGAILRQSVRREDLVFRYGGEEFLILVPGGDRESAAALAERVRKAVQDDPSGSPWGLTVSAGVAVADRFSAANPLGLLRRADVALYQAKRAGRNRVVVDDPVSLGMPRPAGA